MATVITWTVSTDGVTWVTPASLNMAGLQLTERRNGIDEFTWRTDGAYDGDPVWAYASTIYLRQTIVVDGGAPTNTVRFVGRVEGIPRQAAGVQEAVSYKAVGGWWWLERITYSHSWMVFRQSDGTQISVPTPRVVLGQADNGSQRTLGAEITAALNWAIGRGAPFQLGSVDALVLMPLDEQTNIKCADAIRYCLRLMPDLSCWWDYNTTDGAGHYVPTVHCRAAANQTAVSITLPAAAAQSVSLVPRYDIQIPGIRILYESTFTLDGQQVPQIALDTAGSTTDPRCLDLLYELQGGSAEYLTQDVEVAAYPADPNDRAFWRAMVPWLADIADADLVITNGAGDGELYLENYLVSGAVHDWMNVDYEEETWTATVAYIRRDSGGAVREQVEKKAVQVTLISTEAVTQRYRTLKSFTSGESLPSGVAAAIYSSWNRLNYDGRLRLMEQEVTFAAAPQNVVNLTGGRAEWGTMAALVQEAVYQLDAGITDLTIGAGGRWEADSLMALYRAARARRFAWSANIRDDPTSATSSIPGPKAISQKVANDGDPGELKALALKAADSGSRTHVVAVDPSAVTFAVPADAAAQTLQLREVRVLERQADGSYKAKKAQVLCGAIYDNAGGEAIGGGINLAPGAAGQIIYSNGSAWVVSAVGTLAVGDHLVWDGSKYVKATPTQVTMVTAWHLDKTNHKYQVKTRTGYVFSPGAESAWTDISDADGGILDIGVAGS